MNNHEFVKVFTRASDEYPASITAIGASILRYCEETPDMPELFFELAGKANAEVIAQILAAATIRHEQSERSIPPVYDVLAEKIIMESARRARVFMSNDLHIPEFNEILALYAVHHGGNARNESHYF